MPHGAGLVAKKNNEVSVKMDADLYRQIKTVASWRGIGATDCLNAMLKPIVHKEVAKMRRELGHDQDEKE